LKKNKKRLDKITVNGFEYKQGTVIVKKVLKSSHLFAKIEKVFYVDGQIYFKYMPMVSVGFNLHNFGHSVILDTNNLGIIDYDDLFCKTPCLTFNRNDRLFVTTRHIIV